MIEHITHGPLAGLTVVSGEDLVDDPSGRVLLLHAKGELGYLAAQQEWVDDHGDPLEEADQAAADQMVRSGLLPEFEEWFA